MQDESKSMMLNMHQLIEKGNFLAALSLSENLLKADPYDADVYNLQGIALQKMGEEDIGYLSYALASYQKAIQLSPNKAHYWQNYAAALTLSGQLDLAEKACLCAIEANYYGGIAYHFLSQMKKYTEIPSFMKKAQEAVLSVGCSTRSKMFIHFAYGKILDDIGHYDSAFKHFSEANRLSEKQYNITKLQEYCNRLTRFIPQKKATSDCNQPDVTPIFIIGMPRSGTSLLEQILANHTNCAEVGEISIFNDIIKFLQEKNTNNLSYPEILNTADSTLLQEARLMYINRVKHLSRHQPEANFIIDKTIGNYFYVPLILKLFPNARLIHIYRNPLDVCLSCFFTYFQKGFLDFTSNLHSLAEYYEEYRKLMEYWDDTYENVILHISYEKLIENLTQEESKIIYFCGIDFATKFNSHQENTHPIRTASVWQARQPLYKTSINRFKNYEQYISSFPALTAFSFE